MQFLLNNLVTTSAKVKLSVLDLTKTSLTCVAYSDATSYAEKITTWDEAGFLSISGSRSNPEPTGKPISKSTKSKLSDSRRQSDFVIVYI